MKNLDQSKSVLDNMETKEQGFPMKENLQKKSTLSQPMEVISYCPVCSNPIYGYQKTTQVNPEVKRTCTCLCLAPIPNRKGGFAETVQTK